MSITSKDKLSLEILKAFNAGTKVKDIPAKFPVSIDQAKRLSRYNNMLQKAEKHINTPALIKFKDLGL